MRKFVKIEKDLHSPASKFGLDVGKGAIIYLDLITYRMAKFLWSEFLKDVTCLSGNIEALFTMDKEDFEENNKRELED